jgi:hypothetical protein
MNHSIQDTVRQAVKDVKVYDIHTHLYAPAFKDLLLFGIDELLTYHYLISEVFRFYHEPYDKFWTLSKTEQADLIWDELFIKHSPVSEACRGVLTTLNKLGLDVNARDLPTIRKYFAAQNPDQYVDTCMELAGVRKICMTNSPFDDLERPVWEAGYTGDERFSHALRIDPLLMDWTNTCGWLQKQGYNVDVEGGGQTSVEVRRFLSEWAKRMDAQYVMVSLPPDFEFPEKTMRGRLIEEAVLPFCRESGLAFALMPGVKRAVNPQLKLAGDGVGRSNLEPYQYLCANYPDNKFLITVLSRENQHELHVMARKFRNLHPFGCWWFLNNPSLIDEMTRMRLELLGLSQTPQHSDARVLDQLIYKWDHSRTVIGRVLEEKYSDLAATGWIPTQQEIERDVHDLFGGAFEKFLKA